MWLTSCVCLFVAFVWSHSLWTTLCCVFYDYVFLCYFCAFCVIVSWTGAFLSQNCSSSCYLLGCLVPHWWYTYKLMWLSTIDLLQGCRVGGNVMAYASDRKDLCNCIQTLCPFHTNVCMCICGVSLCSDCCLPPSEEHSYIHNYFAQWRISGSAVIQ